MEADPFTRIEGDKGHLSARTAASRATYRLASHVVAASEVVKADLKGPLRVPERKISLIPLPSVDDDLHRLAQAPAVEPPFDNATADPIVITIGNMYPHKDQATLLRAFKLVTAEVRAHLVLIGEGEMRGLLQRLTKELGLANRVTFLGFQKNPFKYLSRSQVFASSSLSEGFDISQIEAMACGLPVIVTDGPRFHVVEHGHTGLVVPAGDAAALAACILEVLRSDELATQLGDQARSAVANFHVSRIARSWEQLILSLVSASGRRSKGLSST
jgi:glycosyltransferase involved in cell wall biosynthesis